VLHRQISIQHAAPWLVSSVSGLYILARARRLSLAEASDAPWTHFLIHQSDVILMLCGCPAIWYIARRRQGTQAPEMVRGTRAQALHQLRQVFTSLLIGTGLLARKAAADKSADLAALAVRLNQIVRDGVKALAEVGEPYPPDLLDEHGAPIIAVARAQGVCP
jgi:hypothetical protein